MSNLTPTESLCVHTLPEGTWVDVALRTRDYLKGIHFSDFPNVCFMGVSSKLSTSTATFTDGIGKVYRWNAGDVIVLGYGKMHDPHRLGEQISQLEAL